MIRLYLDTSTSYLHLGLQQDDQWLEKIAQLANKQQSEVTMPMIEKVFNKYSIKPWELDEIIITEGPGSYTGIRIAMTIAKVLGAIGDVSVYTLNTLQVMAGKSDKMTLAMIDARSKRAYVAVNEDKKTILEPQIMPIDELKDLSFVQCVGDCYLIDKTSITYDFLENMYLLKNEWKKVDEVHKLVPLYLKETNEYGQS